MAPIRKNIIATDKIYHVFNKSIAGFRIFNTEKDYEYMMALISYYRFERRKKFSAYRDFGEQNDSEHEKKLIEIISYCLMPTHFHFILKQSGENGICNFVRKISDSYSRYFNLRHNRKGPLWEGRFKNVLIKGDSQLLHLTRYIHLNPVTSFLKEKPEDWKYSSYREYLNLDDQEICEYNKILSIKKTQYKDFVDERIDYQRKLALIKNLILE